MQLPQNYLHKGKNALHGLQGLVIFLGWALTIAILVKDGPSDGRTKYFFALVSAQARLAFPELIDRSAGSVYQFSSTKQRYLHFRERSASQIRTPLPFSMFCLQSCGLRRLSAWQYIQTRGSATARQKTKTTS